MSSIPPAIPGSKEALSDQLTVSILIDRSLALECGKGVLVLATADEAAALLLYLQKHRRKFQKGGHQ